MPSGSQTGWIYLVDAHSLIYQVFHAIRQPMTSPGGIPTNALFGFTRDLLALREKKPESIVVAFDRHEPTFRSTIYPAYKANREAMPSDLQVQIPLIYQVLEALALPVLSFAGFEADDILATLAHNAASQGHSVLICTADKDCRQLITDQVRLFNFRKGEEFGRQELLTEWGIRPDQVVDLQTLVGDSVDNVPGVPGIGYKTAAKLLQDFDTIENILANIKQVPGARKQEALLASQEILVTSRHLVTLDTQVPIPIEWDSWKLKPVNKPRLLALFHEWGFHTMARQVREMDTPMETTQGRLFPESEGLFSSPGQSSPSLSTRKNGLPARTGASVPDVLAVGTPLPADEVHSRPVTTHGDPGWQADYQLVDSAELLSAFIQKLTQQPRFAFDLETTALQPWLAEIVGIAFSWQLGTAYYLPLRGPAGSALLDPQSTLDQLRPLFENPRIGKLNQNIKYDLLVLRAQGIEVQGVSGDSMVADYLLHAGERSHNLEELARRYLNHQVIPITDLIGKKSRKQPQQRMDEIATSRVAIYSGEDADVAWRLCQMLEPRLEQVQTPVASPIDTPDLAIPTQSLRQLYDSLEIPLIQVLVEMEANGIRLDLPRLRQISAEMDDQLREIETEIYALAGREFSINSLVQLRKVLFDDLKLPMQRKTGVTGAASTDQETLEKLAALEHPGAGLPRKILEHRQISKLKGTYVDALPLLVNPRTGRVHASFNQTVAATGRLSASDPNLQNIPVRREQGQQIRQAFLPEAGWELITADYSQIELRLLAHFSADESLCQAFAEDRDVHSLVAAQIFQVDPEAVTAAQRRVAKTVNFGVIYGMSAHGLAQRLGIPRGEADRFIREYFARYSRVLDYQTRLLERCRLRGYVSTILGRRRAFDASAIRPGSTYQQRNQAEREAINMEVQGSAADLIKLAMCRLLKRLRQDRVRARLLLQIHDELVLEAPPEEVATLLPRIREEMTTPLEKQLQLKVPLRVDLGVGPNWLDVQDVPV